MSGQMSDHTSEETEFERLAKLLPFYVNGTLDKTSCRQVETALAASPELRRLLAEERDLAAAVARDTAGRMEKGKGHAKRADRPGDDRPA